MPNFSERDRSNEIGDGEQARFIELVDNIANDFGISAPGNYEDFAASNDTRYNGTVDLDPVSEGLLMPSLSFTTKPLPGTETFIVQREIYLRTPPELLGGVALRACKRFGINDFPFTHAGGPGIRIPYVVEESEYAAEDEQDTEPWFSIGIELGMLKAFIREHGSFDKANQVVRKALFPEARTFTHDDYEELMINMGQS